MIAGGKSQQARAAAEAAPTLSTIHKAKGMEWERVFWLREEPPARAWQEWQERQEINLNYVAATRAKRELILVES